MKSPNIFMTGKRFFLKPDRGFSGAGIKIVSDGSELEQHIMGNKKYNTWVAQEYIEDPHLYQGRKYHIRALFLVDRNGSYVFSEMPVYLAEKEYVADSEDPLVHITHYTEDQPPLYTDDLVDADLAGRLNAAQIAKGISVLTDEYEQKDLLHNIIGGAVMSILKDVVDSFQPGCYDESPECYEVLAADFTMDNNGRVYLLEVNDKIGLKQFTGDGFGFNKILLHSSLAVAVDHRFPPAKQPKQTVLFDNIRSEYGRDWLTNMAGDGMYKNPIPLKLPRPLPGPAELAVRASTNEEFEAVVYGYILSQGQIVHAEGKAGLKQALTELGIWDGPVLKAWREETGKEVTDTMEIVLKMLKETLG